MNILRISGLLLAGLLASHISYGQAVIDSALALNASKEIKQYYLKATNSNYKLYDGPEYIFYNRYYKNNQGNQFFNSDQETTEQIVYDGIVYNDIPLLYDVNLDQIVLTHPTSSLKLRLVNERVQRFTVQGHTFVRLISPKTDKSSLPTGFYDILSNQGITLVARREKTMQKKAEQSVVKVTFLESITYYILLNGIYHPINSLSNFTNLFPDQKAALQKYARSNKLKFTKANREKSLIKLAQHYTTINK